MNRKSKMDSEVYPELLVKVEIEDPSPGEQENRDFDSYHSAATNNSSLFLDTCGGIKADPVIYESDGNVKYSFQNDSPEHETDQLSCDEDCGREGNGKLRTVSKHGYGQLYKLNESLENQQQTQNEKRFPTKSCLRKEESGHTKKKPLMCSDCGKPYFQRSELKAHMRIHTGEKPFTCTECGKSFLRKSHLVRHMNIHTREKSLDCNVCGNAFSLKSELKAHMRIHTGEKPFICTECGEAFMWKSRLIPHMRIHTGEKPFTCNQCGKAFLRKSHHNAHMKIHTGEKPFMCEDCGKAFYRRSHLMLHKKSHRRKAVHML